MRMAAQALCGIVQIAGRHGVCLVATGGTGGGEGGCLLAIRVREALQPEATSVPVSVWFAHGQCMVSGPAR